MKMQRRQLLQALGFGALASVVQRGARADEPETPKRIVFYVQPHGNIPNAWNMPIPDGPTDAFAQRSLADLAPEDLSPTLRPFHAFRKRILAIEGLSHTAALAISPPCSAPAPATRTTIRLAWPTCSPARARCNDRARTAAAARARSTRSSGAV